MEIKNNIDKDPKKCESEKLALKAYSRPEITELGSMQKLTLDSSQIGTEDSGGVGPTYTYD